MPSPEELTRMGEALTTMRLPTDWDGGPAIEAVANAGVPGLIATGGWSPAFEAIGDGLAQRLGMSRLMVDAGHHFAQAVQPAFNDALEASLARAEQR